MTPALEGCEWSAARLGRTLPPGKTRYPFYRRLDGPHGRSGRVQKISSPPRFDPGPSNIEPLKKLKKVKWSRYRPGLAQRVGRGIALLFHDSGTRRGWVVSSTPRPHFTPGKDPVTFLQEAGWAPGPVWTDGKSLPHRDSIPHRPI